MGVEELLETAPVCKRARKRLRAVVTSEDEQDSSIRLIFASGGSSPRFDDGLYNLHEDNTYFPSIVSILKTFQVRKWNSQLNRT